MFSFFLAVFKILRAVARAAVDREFRALAFVTFILLLSGSVFYSHAEGWSAVDAMYFCVMTMTTIGYGDLVPTSSLSKLFTIIYAFLSIGIFVSLAAKLAAAMMKGNGQLKAKRNPPSKQPRGQA